MEFRFFGLENAPETKNIPLERASQISHQKLAFVDMFSNTCPIGRHAEASPRPGMRPTTTSSLYQDKRETIEPE